MIGFQHQWVFIHISLGLMGKFLLTSVELQMKPALGAVVYPAQDLPSI